MTATDISILGVQITPMSMDRAVETAISGIETGQLDYINFCSVNDIVEGVKDRAVAKAINQGLGVSDGMPLVWLCKYMGFKQSQRIYGPDFMLAFCRASLAKGFRHFFYGGGPGVARALAETLKIRFPGLVVAGTFTPGLIKPGERENMQVIQYINSTRPDIIWVGLGAPKQNLWMARHRPYLTAPILAAVGAAFDFHTGNQPQAPGWMQQRGLEWLFRLMKDPVRLWPRYLINNPLFMILILMQVARLHKFTPPQ